MCFWRRHGYLGYSIPLRSTVPVLRVISCLEMRTTKIKGKYSNAHLNAAHWARGCLSIVTKEITRRYIIDRDGDILTSFSLQWRHNERGGVSHQRRLDCLLNCLLRRRSKKTSKLRVTGLWLGNSPVNYPQKGPVTRKMFPFDDVIISMLNEFYLCLCLGYDRPCYNGLSWKRVMLISHIWQHSNPILKDNLNSSEAKDWLGVVVFQFPLMFPGCH